MTGWTGTRTTDLGRLTAQVATRMHGTLDGPTPHTVQPYRPGDAMLPFDQDHGGDWWVASNAGLFALTVMLTAAALSHSLLLGAGLGAMTFAACAAAARIHEGRSMRDAHQLSYVTASLLGAYRLAANDLTDAVTGGDPRAREILDELTVMLEHVEALAFAHDDAPNNHDRAGVRDELIAVVAEVVATATVVTVDDPRLDVAVHLDALRGPRDRLAEVAADTRD